MMVWRGFSLVVVLVSLLGQASNVASFVIGGQRRTQSIATFKNTQGLESSSALFMNKPEYDQKTLLREEAESPFRKVRFFLYASLAGGALISLAVSATRIAAAAAGVNTDLMEQSLTNAAVDLAGIVVLGFLYRQDETAQESRLKRASKGAEVARLQVRALKSLISGGIESNAEESETFVASLADMRRGRGIEKRVVIAVGGEEKIADTIKEANELNDSLSLSDLLIVPVVLPKAESPALDLKAAPSCVALPVGQGWKGVVADEVSEAKEQGVDVEKEGICVILKKNGRVGQRTKGIFLRNMVGEVTERRELGMDVTNI